MNTESAISSTLRRNDTHPRDSQSSRLWQRKSAHRSQKPSRRCRMHLIPLSHASRRLEIETETGAKMWVISSRVGK